MISVVILKKKNAPQEQVILWGSEEMRWRGQNSMSLNIFCFEFKAT